MHFRMLGPAALGRPEQPARGAPAGADTLRRRGAAQPTAGALRKACFQSIFPCGTSKLQTLPWLPGSAHPQPGHQIQPKLSASFITHRALRPVRSFARPASGAASVLGPPINSRGASQGVPPCRDGRRGPRRPALLGSAHPRPGRFARRSFARAASGGPLRAPLAAAAARAPCPGERDKGGRDGRGG